MNSSHFFFLLFKLRSKSFPVNGCTKVFQRRKVPPVFWTINSLCIAFCPLLCEFQRTAPNWQKAFPLWTWFCWYAERVGKTSILSSSFWVRINHDHSCRMMQILAGAGGGEGIVMGEQRTSLVFPSTSPFCSRRLCGWWEELQEADSYFFFFFLTS